MPLQRSLTRHTRLPSAAFYEAFNASHRPRLRRWAGVFGLLLVCLGMAVRPAVAQEVAPTTKQTSTLTLTYTQQAMVGQPIMVEATLSAENIPIPNNLVRLSLNNRQIAEANTDENGMARFSLDSDAVPSVGEYLLLVSFMGNDTAERTQSAGLLSIRPIPLTIVTVPPIAGVRFAIEEFVFTSGPDGIATFDVFAPGTYRLEALQPVARANSQQITRIAFNQWQDGRISASRQLTVDEPTTLQAGFDLIQRISIDITNPNNQPLDPQRVERIQLRSSLGGIERITDYRADDAYWLQSQFVQKMDDRLESRAVTYTLLEVLVDNANAVNLGELQFMPSPAETVTIPTRLFSAEFMVVDAIFGSPMGDGLLLEAPDGSTQTLLLDENGSARLGNLVRGLYYVTVEGALGMAQRQPLIVSQDQMYNIDIVSWANVGIGLLGSVLLLVGLIIIMRWRLLLSLRKSDRFWVVMASMLLMGVGLVLTVGVYSVYRDVVGQVLGREADSAEIRPTDETTSPNIIIIGGTGTPTVEPTAIQLEPDSLIGSPQPTQTSVPTIIPLTQTPTPNSNILPTVTPSPTP